jgi:hypothetical protein
MPFLFQSVHHRTTQLPYDQSTTNCVNSCFSVTAIIRANPFYETLIAFPYLIPLQSTLYNSLFTESLTGLSKPGPCETASLLHLGPCILQRFSASWYGVKCNPGNQYCIGSLLSSHYTPSSGNSHSFLSKSLLHCWKRAIGCILQ